MEVCHNRVFSRGKNDGVFQASFFRGRTVHFFFFLGGDDISHIFSFLSGQKKTPKKPPGDSSRDSFYPLVGGHELPPWKRERVNSVYPQRGHPAELPKVNDFFFQPDLSGQAALMLMIVYFLGW